jgi:hypothetical protein
MLSMGDGTPFCAETHESRAGTPERMLAIVSIILFVAPRIIADIRVKSLAMSRISANHPAKPYNCSKSLLHSLSSSMQNLRFKLAAVHSHPDLSSRVRRVHFRPFRGIQPTS